jgi:N-methylhydantoinase B
MTPDRRYPLVQYELPAGAIGARADGDGVSASKAHVANGTITPVEIIESEFPVEVVRFELLPDSGGAGRFRGGLSYVREYRMAGDAQFSARGGYLRTPPQGRDGGAPGASGATVINPGSADEHRVTAGDGIVRLHEGDILRREMTGAGGFGDPHTRDVDSVLQDVCDGYVSSRAARESYGVVVAPGGHTWVVDHEATAALRGSRPTEGRERPAP